MFELLANFLCGYYILRIPREMRGAIFDWMLRRGVPFFREKNDADGVLTFRIPAKYKSVFESTASDIDASNDPPPDGASWSCSALRGFPVQLLFLRRRPGIALGAALLLAWSWFSGKIIWEIQIEGNTTTPDSEIVALLDELGCGYGAWIPSVCFDDIHARFLAASDTISWISVYMNGVVAEVQVREQIRRPEQRRDEGVYANVVAKEDGVIELVRVFEGQATVRTGDVVRAGDVIISGVMEKKDDEFPEGGARYEYAAGEASARTVRRIDVEIALSREEKVYTGRETVRKSVKIFGNVVNLFQNTGIAYAKYDKIEEERRLSLWGLRELPIWVEKTVYREYEYEVREISTERAVAEGLSELRRQIEEASEDGEILEKDLTASFENGKYTIACLLYCLRDIAKTVEFSVDRP